jgi:hypothetical protein
LTAEEKSKKVVGDDENYDEENEENGENDTN